jgi:hypothetical protein
MAIKKFYSIGSRVQLYKTFSAVIYKVAKKIECLSLASLSSVV